jgi:hypothetical protein
LEPGSESEPFALNRRSGLAGQLQTAAQYTSLGFEHIVPLGIDHILFVLGLFFLSAQFRPILLQVTAFTLAHSVTLALAIYGLVDISPRIVEPLIALSIVFVAVENLFSSRLQPWRLAVVLGFGLLHGLGFAGVLSELGLPKSHFLVGLVGFNVGVELGQLAVIAGAMLLVGYWSRRSWYRRRISMPSSVLIASVGLFWTAQRLLT